MSSATAGGPRLGSTAATLHGENGETRIYYQATDGSIKEWSGFGPLTGGSTYTERTLIPTGSVRVNTPLAAYTWGGTRNGSFKEIRFYYIGSDHHVREIMCNFYSSNWVRGVFDSQNYIAAPNSSVLYAIGGPGNPRVGFQSAADPGTITEAEFDNGWTTETLKLN